ncbi:MAG TPA: TMEM175 family protein [Gemmatimonadaceae bacterium]|nr:TMEM175 family protein [Gemmatimonadaceae bacterium]
MSEHATSRGPATRVVELGETTRLETFSDGVFAIAITLLVLEIRVPAAHGETALGSALLHLWPSYLGYLISFATIGIMWVNHHTMFEHIRRVNRTFLLINVVFLLVIGFIPFPTAVLAEHLPQPEGRRVATLFYGASFTVMAIVYNLVWRYGAGGDGRLLGAAADLEEARAITRSYTWGPIIYLVATLIALASPIASLVAHALIALFFTLPPRSSAKAVPEVASGGGRR